MAGKPEMPSPEQVTEQEAAFRKQIAETPAQYLLDYLKSTINYLSVRSFTSGFGLHDDNPQVDQQYRMTQYAIEQELLRRLDHPTCNV